MQDIARRSKIGRKKQINVPGKKDGPSSATKEVDALHKASKNVNPNLNGTFGNSKSRCGDPIICSLHVSDLSATQAISLVGKASQVTCLWQLKPKMSESCKGFHSLERGILQAYLCKLAFKSLRSTAGWYLLCQERSKIAYTGTATPKSRTEVSKSMATSLSPQRQERPCSWLYGENWASIVHATYYSSALRWHLI